MKRILKFTLVFLGIIFSVSIYSQKRTEDFSISFSDTKLEKSYYKNIKLIDARIDSTSLGIVQKGAFNAKARVVPTTNLNDQFQTLLNHINGENTEDGTIVVYLKQLYFAEITGARLLLFSGVSVC